MEKLLWKTVSKKINSLVPYSQNPRVMTEKQVDALTKSIEKFGFVEIPVIDLDGTIIAGHQRLRVQQLRGRGDEMVDVRVPNRKLTDEEVKQYNVISNKVSAGWDYDMLLANFEMEELEEMSFSVNDFDLNIDKYEKKPKLCPKCGYDLNETSDDF